MKSSINNENKDIKSIFKRRHLLSKISFSSSDFEKEFQFQKNYLLNMSKISHNVDNFSQRKQFLDLFLKNKRAKRLLFLNFSKKFIISFYWFENNFFLFIVFMIIILFFKGYLRIMTFSSLDFISLPFRLK